jgi:hypothetical protein
MVSWVEMLLAINKEIHAKKKEREGGKNSSTTVRISLHKEIYKKIFKLEPDAHISNLRT